jgi:prepilin-type N-terminal cleavage/methylation domain-containing protein
MRRRRDGFTLVELMIVVTIMGAMAALIVPGIGEFLADARAASAAEALVRISRHMQARAHQTGLAHMLVFGGTSTESGGLGVVRVYEGMNNHCRQTPWAQTIGGREDEGHAPVDALDMGWGEYNPPTGGKAPAIDDRDRMVISLRVTGAAAAPDAAILCVEPSGAVWEGVAASTAGSGFVFTKPVAKTSIDFIVSRKMNSVVRGRERTVSFSTSGIARFRF